MSETLFKEMVVRSRGDMSTLDEAFGLRAR